MKNNVRVFAFAVAFLAPIALAQTPHFVEVTKVHRSNPQRTSENFGHVVSLDGDTMVVARSVFQTDGGAAYVYVRNGNGAWVLQQTLSDNTPESNYGSCVGVSGDTVIVGARSADKVYVYLRTNSVWALQDTLVPDLAGSLSFGGVCAVNGNTVLVQERSGSPGSVPVYVFVRNGVTWSKQTKLTEIAPATNGVFGDSVAIDGDTAAIGVQNTIGGVGAVNVFLRTGTSWAPQQRLQTSDLVSGDLFGASVALNGSTLIAGAPESAGSGFRTGAAYVFTRSGATWTQQQKLVTSDGSTNADFGSSVTVENDVAIVWFPVGQQRGRQRLGIGIRLHALGNSVDGDREDLSRRPASWERLRLEPRPEQLARRHRRRSR